MIVTKYYIPFQMITLFDISIHKKLKGVLIFPYPEKQKFNRFRFYQNLGIASLLLGILGYTITLVPLLTTQARYLSNINKAPVRLAQTQGFQSISNTNYDFKIFIPKLSLDANIIDQVDPNIDREYTEKLKKAWPMQKDLLIQTNLGRLTSSRTLLIQYLISNSTTLNFSA